MRNEEIRNEITDNGLRYWQVAECMGISDNTLTRWLRSAKISKEQKQKIYKAIETLKGAN